MLFLDSYTKEVQNIAKNSNRITTVEDLKKCCRQLNRWLESTSGKQFIDALNDEFHENSRRLLILREGVAQDYDIIERFIKGKFNSSSVIYCLEKSRAEEASRQAEFPSWREAGLRVALRHGIKIMINAYSLEMNALFLDSLIQKEIDLLISEMLQTANVNTWITVNSANKKLSEIRRDICYIKNFKSGLSNSTDLRRLKGAIQCVSMAIACRVETMMALSFKLIDDINFNFSANKDPVKSFCIITINKIPSRFDGLRAENLNVLFSNPDCEEDIDRFKFTRNVEKKSVAAKNDNLRKDFEDINRQICGKYYQFGFIYGFRELIISDKYLHNINPYFVPYINKSTEKY